MKKICIFVCLIAFTASVRADSIGIPEGVVNTQNSSDRTISPLESLKRITVPEGFNVTLFAGEPNLAQPIAMTFDDRGRLWVAENYSHPKWNETGKDRIVIFEDTDQDGVFDVRKVFYDKGNYISGLIVGFGGVYVCNVPNLLFIPDRDGDDVPDGEPFVLLNGWAKSSPHNVFNNLVWGPDGWLYGCVGQNGGSRIGKPGTPDEERIQHSRGIWRYHPIRGTFEVVAFGPVNPWGLDFNEVGEGFFVNCVLPHLWQMIPGAHYQRRGGERDNPYAYGRMESIADHLHWGGGQWTPSRGGQGIHNTPGGGHAHTGAMIYLGNNWPDAYRHSIFMGNIHGNRINNDVLERKGSGYVGRHHPDFLQGNHPWFRSLSQKYGPDGGVFMSDWHDFGECHDSDGSHRTSGRIYKVVYGKPNPLEPFDLRRMPSENLVALQTHRNDWFTRHARRILQERAVAGDEMTPVHQKLWAMFQDSKSPAPRLRALWGLWVTGGISENQLIEISTDFNEDIRSWAIRFMCESNPTDRAVARLGGLARTDGSPKVRMVLASMLQRISVNQRWPIATALMEHAEDNEDSNIPLLLWYGMEPLVIRRTDELLDRMPETGIRIIRRFTARRLIDEDEAAGLERLTQFLLKQSDLELQHDMLTGMTSALRGRRSVQPPPGWTAFYEKTIKEKNPENLALATMLSAIFKDENALKRLRFKARDNSTDKATRRLAARALNEAGDPEGLPIMYDFLEDPELRSTALKGFSAYDNPEISARILKHYAAFTDDEKRLAVEALASRATTAAVLLDAIQNKKIAASDVPIHTVRHLQQFKEKEIVGRLNEIWGYIQKTAGDKAQLIEDVKKKLTPEVLAQADPSAGRKVFNQSCVACHTLFGEGGEIGPDLTGSGRSDLSYVLENVLDPSALITREYQLATVATRDGRTLSGMIRNRTDKTLALKMVADEIVLPLNTIKKIDTATSSMMPEGLLQSLTDEQVRDLMGYLASPVQVPLSR